MTTELLPCPFCSGQATTEHLESGLWSVGCMDDQCIAFISQAMFPREIEAVTAWNTRASTQALAERVEKAESTLRIAREALCEYACHLGENVPCLRTKQQCLSECGKAAGDAIIAIDAALNPLPHEEGR